MTVNGKGFNVNINLIKLYSPFYDCTRKHHLKIKREGSFISYAPSWVRELGKRWIVRRLTKPLGERCMFIVLAFNF